MHIERTGVRPSVLVRLLIGALLLLGLAALASSIATEAQAGAAGEKVTVNSRSNTDDGDCEGPPNDNVIGGDCTLHEAIDSVNAGHANLINFHPPVFPKANPGVINIEDDEGCLPPIERDGVTIDSEATGVILDGDSDDLVDDPDTPINCHGAFEVHAVNNGFDFTILGGQNLTIREFFDDGVQMDGNDYDGSGYSFGDVLISGIIIEDVYGDGIEIDDSRGARNIVITDSHISAAYPEARSNQDPPCCSENAIEIVLDDEVFDDGIIDSNQSIDISDNKSIFGEEDGIEIFINGDLGDPFTGSIAKIAIKVNNNDSIDVDRDADEGVDIEYRGCISKSTVNVNVDGNGRITGGEFDAVDVDIFADADDGDCKQIVNSVGRGEAAGFAGNGSDRASANVSVSDNRNVEVLDGPNNDDGEGIDVDVDFCCGESESVANVVIDGNGDVTGAEEGVKVDLEIGCGHDNKAHVSVSENGRVTGEDGDGVKVDADIGAVDNPCSGGESDGNVATVVIDDNNRLTGNEESEAAGVDVDIDVGSDADDGDDNRAEVEVTNNRRLDGEDDGMQVNVDAGSDCGDGDDNLARILVEDNEQADGGTGDGGDLDADAGSLGELCNGASPPPGDDNRAEIIVRNNDRFVGNDGEGVEIDLFAGGQDEADKGSLGNETYLLVTENGDIEGEGADHEGLEVDADVCCASRKANNNIVDIVENEGVIVGHDDSGIDVEFGETVSSNIVTIRDNEGEIRGGDEAGIDYDAIDGDLADDLDQDGFFNTVNKLTIVNNNISNSGRDGIEICCGAFEDEEWGKSVISNNVIHHNADHGIEVDSSFGLNIGPDNVISENGDDPDLDAGIEIDNSSVVDEEFCVTGFGAEAGGGGLQQQLPQDCFEIPANHNKITQNSIFDNIGLGIDLAADEDEDGGGPEDTAAEDGDGDGNSDEDHGVGCELKETITSNPNDCLPHPVILTQSGNKLVGTACSRCTVEIFIADATPADQTGGPEDQHFGEQHGEGRTYVVSGEADAGGNWSIQLPCGMGAAQLTATSTDKVKNTSEFANNRPTLGTSACATPTNTQAPPPAPADTAVPTSTATSAPPAATDTPAPTATSEPEPAGLCGDVDGDGAVTPVDAALVVQVNAGLIEAGALAAPEQGDVNNDGSLSSVDAALILQRVANLISQAQLTCPA